MNGKVLACLDVMKLSQERKESIYKHFLRIKPFIEKYGTKEKLYIEHGYFDGSFVSFYSENKNGFVEIQIYSGGISLSCRKEIDGKVIDSDDEWFEIDENRSYSCFEKDKVRVQIPNKVTEEYIKLGFSYL